MLDETLTISKKNSRQVDRVAQKRIAQTISQISKEVERVAPLVMKNAIEKLYKTPFCLLEKLDWQKYNVARPKKTQKNLL